MFAFCCLRRSTAAWNCVVVELVRILDTEVRLRGLQVESRVRDVDRAVVRGDLALVRRSGVPDDAPAVRLGLDDVRAPHEQVRPASVRDAVGDAVDRVVRLVLQALEDRVVVLDQVEVDRGHVLACDQSQCRVARRRDTVVVAGLHQRDHLVRGRADLRVDLAARLCLEGSDPVLLDVAGPVDQVHLTLSRADRAEHPFGRGGRRSRTSGAVLVVVAAAARRRKQRDAAVDRKSGPAGLTPSCLAHSSSISPPGSISYVCSGRHSRRTGRPRASTTSVDVVSRF